MKHVTKKFLATAALLAMVVTGFPGAPANAALTPGGAVGPTNPTTGFPIWYMDQNGLKLDLMEAADAMALSAPVVAGNAFSEQIGFGAEGFWWSAEASIDDGAGHTGLLVLALEAAFSGGEIPTDGQQSAFGRIRYRITGLTPGATYTVTHPFATASEVADGAGVINVTSDIGGFGVAGFPANYNIALSSGIGPFLTWDTFNPNPALNDPQLKNLAPAYANRVYVGNPNVPHAITGGPNGNSFTVAGPGLAGFTTNQFNVSGRLFSPKVTINPQTAFTTTPTVTGTVSDPTAAVVVTVGTDPANANIPATVNPTTGVWTAAVSSPLANGKFDVTATVGAGTPNESATTQAGAVSINPASATVFRFWSDAKQGHFFTVSEAEKNTVIAQDASWAFEGNAYKAYAAQEPGTTPVFRFWSAAKQHHFFTVSEAEKNQIIANDPSWTFEGTAFYTFAAPQTGTTPVYRFWSDAKQGHFFTTSEAEKNAVIANDPSWRFEGIAYHVPAN